MNKRLKKKSKKRTSTASTRKKRNQRNRAEFKQRERLSRLTKKDDVIPHISSKAKFFSKRFSEMKGVGSREAFALISAEWRELQNTEKQIEKQVKQDDVAAVFTPTKQPPLPPPTTSMATATPEKEPKVAEPRNTKKGADAKPFMILSGIGRKRHRQLLLSFAQGSVEPPKEEATTTGVATCDELRDHASTDAAHDAKTGSESMAGKAAEPADTPTKRSVVPTSCELMSDAGDGEGPTEEADIGFNLFDL